MTVQGPREAFIEAFSAEVEDDELLRKHIDLVLARLYLLGYVIAPAHEDSDLR